MKKLCVVLLLLFMVFASSSSFAENPIHLYAPPTPSSIPILLAAGNMDNVEVTVFSNHSQAHTLFLRGDTQVLTTGLSVGVNFFNNDIPVQMINSYVSGLSHLVTRDRQVSRFQELQGEDIYLPFEGSPLEEVTRYFVQQEGLEWKKDIQPVYSPFPSSLELLKKGDAQVVVLPQPLATVAAAQEDIFVSFGYKEKWDALTGGTTGYPQVGTFVKADWAAEHKDFIRTFHQELETALQLIQDDPAQAVALTQGAFKFPEKILIAALKKTDFHLSTSTELQEDIRAYYRTVGAPLDDTFDAFFYLDQE